MERKNIQNTVMSLMIGGVAGAALTWAGLTYGGGEVQNSSYPEIARIREIRKVLEEHGVTIDPDKALNGYMMYGIDEYSAYGYFEDTYSTTDYINESGTAIASGFQIDKSEDGLILLTDVEEDKAAYNSGLRAGDEIVKIDGKDVKSFGYDNIADKLLGKQDTTVELKVLRGGSEVDVTFKRDNDPMHSLEWKDLDGLGYIRIKEFGMFAAGNMTTAVNELKDSRGYIIDLRENTGGNLGICADLLKNIAPGTVICMDGYDGTEKQMVVETDPNVISGPVVILVNSNTASSSEVITTAVKQFNHEAVVVGETTYGKGIYQNTESLQSGGQIRYTAGKVWVSGCDEWNGKGIEPDIKIEMSSDKIGTDEDIQLKKAIELLD